MLKVLKGLHVGIKLTVGYLKKNWEKFLLNSCVVFSLEKKNIGKSFLLKEIFVEAILCPNF
jgi:hypothetical protein